jgi:hydrogenase maturation protease
VKVSAFTASRSTPLPADDGEIAEIGLIGIGNTLMGDDGAGIIAVEKVRLRNPDPKKVFIYALQRDLFEMADLLDRSRRFIFVDVYLGSPAGTIALFKDRSANLMP